jgi:hypothetical protein
LRRFPDRLEYEADPRHVKEILKGLDLQENSKGLDWAARRASEAEVKEATPLEAGQASKYRSLTARANFLALDRADIQFAVKELCKEMSAPTTLSWSRLKQLGRYLLKNPRMVWTFPMTSKESLGVIDVHSDSDWAGCLQTRKSTSAGVISMAGATLKTWSSTQKTIARSSGEAELYAMVKAASEGLAMQALAREMGLEAALHVCTDSSAAVGIASRQGVGKIRHLSVSDLWVQECVRQGRFVLSRVPGSRNPADAMTKPLACVDVSHKLHKVGGRVGIHLSATASEGCGRGGV